MSVPGTSGAGPCRRHIRWQLTRPPAAGLVVPARPLVRRREPWLVRRAPSAGAELAPVAAAGCRGSPTRRARWCTQARRRCRRRTRRQHADAHRCQRGPSPTDDKSPPRPSGCNGHHPADAIAPYSDCQRALTRDLRGQSATVCLSLTVGQRPARVAPRRRPGRAYRAPSIRASGSPTDLTCWASRATRPTTFHPSSAPTRSPGMAAACSVKRKSCSTSISRARRTSSSSRHGCAGSRPRAQASASGFSD